jgi:hypothetical protein
MDEHHIDCMVLRLRPILKDKLKAERILKKYWTERMALVWEVKDVHKAANEREVALTNGEAIELLQDLHHHHNPQYGIRWQDITNLIQDRVLGRPLTKAEIKHFVERHIITVQK